MTNPFVWLRSCPRWTGWLCYVAAVALFLELSLQLFYRLTTGAMYWSDSPALYVGDPVSGYTNKPDLSFRHVTPEFAADLYTNSQGFRVSRAHEEYAYDTAQGTLRILLLGPSFAYGWGVNYEQTFGEQLRRRLDSGHLPGYSQVEVLNHGVPGLPAANSVEWFLHRGKNYSPHIVLLFVYGSMDESEEPAPSPLVSSVKKIWSYAKLSATVYYGGVVAGLGYRAWHGFDPERPIEGAGRPMINRTAFSTDDPRVGESIRLYRRLNDEARGAGAQLLIVHFPLPYVVHPQDMTRWVLHGVTNVEQQKQFNRNFCAYLNGQDIPCLDLTDDLITAGRQSTERLYFWLDIHWTERGNAVAAQVVSSYLASSVMAQAN